MDCSPNTSGEETVMLGHWADVIVELLSSSAGRRHLENVLMVALFLDWKKGLVVFRPSGETPRLKKTKLAVVYTWVPN